MALVSVVTDSTGYLPRELVERNRISVVSLYYTFGDGVVSREGECEDYAPFYARLAAGTGLPTTTPPQLEDFLSAYEPLLADGGSVLSVHISSGLSETCTVARRAATQLAEAGKGGERIRVMDSATSGGQLGTLALVAATAAARGADLETVADRVRQARLEARNWVLLDTLEFMRRGGRVGSATAWVGSTLNIKPIITIESEVRAVERVRTRERGVERLIELGRQLQASGFNAWCVQHAEAADDASRLVARLQEIFREPPIFISELGPVVGTYAGPGCFVIAGLPRRFIE